MNLIYPQNFHNQIICGDCLEVMQDIPDNSIDMILADLPYGVTNRNKWDVILPFDQLWDQYKRITKPNAAIVLTAVASFAAQLITSNPKMFKYDLIWEKNLVTGHLNARKMPMRKHEQILVFYQKQPIYNPQKTTNHKPMNSFTHYTDSLNYGKTKIGYSGGKNTDRHPTSVIKIDAINNNTNVRLHSTQKPLELCKYLIKTYTNENMIVLDNCVGVGSTAVAAKNLNRIFIGIEIDQNYCDIAKNRLFTESQI